MRGVTPHKGKGVCLSLYNSTRTGREPATTSCDDTCIHALNIETLKKLQQTSLVVSNTAAQTLNTSDNDFYFKPFDFIVM